MKVRYLFFGAILPALFLAGCASAPKVVEEKKNEPVEDVIVMDDAASDSVAHDLPDETEKPEVKDIAEAPPVQEAKVSEESTSYYIQVGAFKTIGKAESFAKKLKGKVNQELSVRYNSKVDLYVVRLQPVSSRDQADALLARIRRVKELADAFIVHD